MHDWSCGIDADTFGAGRSTPPASSPARPASRGRPACAAPPSALRERRDDARGDRDVGELRAEVVVVSGACGAGVWRYEDRGECRRATRSRGRLLVEGLEQGLTWAHVHVDVAFLCKGLHDRKERVRPPSCGASSVYGRHIESVLSHENVFRDERAARRLARPIARPRMLIPWPSEFLPAGADRLARATNDARKNPAKKKSRPADFGSPERPADVERVNVRAATFLSLGREVLVGAWQRCSARPGPALARSGTIFWRRGARMAPGGPGRSPRLTLMRDCASA